MVQVINSVYIDIKINNSQNLFDSMASEKSFTDLEIKILKQIVPKSAYPPQLKYSQLSSIFTQKTEQMGHSSWKSGRSIKTQLTKMYKRQNIPWSLQMEKIAIACVSEGREWKQIAKEEVFMAQAIQGKKIKSCFESNMRHKLRIIGRYASSPDKNFDKNLSDIAFKAILTGKVPESIAPAFTSKEKQILKSICSYFKISQFQKNGKKLKIRSKQVQSMMLQALYQFDYSLDQILATLVKFKSQLFADKKNGSFKLIQSSGSSGLSLEPCNQISSLLKDQDDQNGERKVEEKLMDSTKLKQTASFSTLQSLSEMPIKQVREDFSECQSINFFESFGVQEIFYPII